MISRSNRGLPVLVVGLTLSLALARVWEVPPLSDPVGAPLPEGLHLVLPWPYLLAAPLFDLWDGVSMLSMRRLGGFLTGLLLLFVLWRVLRGLARKGTSIGRELLALGLSLAALAAFIAAGLLWHRPMAALAGTAPDQVVVDFHTHTQRSHDVAGTAMSDYDVASNLRWHRRAGFDAAFITDHNTVGPLARGEGLAIGCPGIEVSAWRAHVVLLGNTVPVDRSRYNRDLASLLELLRSSETEYGALSVASIPEYVRNHWDRLDTLVAAGLDGFEVVNASPKANEITRAQRDTVIALARRTDRFVVGVSDHHGWGATSMVWNLVEVPGWRAAREGVCAAILRKMGDGFGSVQIVERHRLRPDDAWPLILTPLGVLWETWRSMGWPETARLASMDLGDLGTAPAGAPVA